MATYCLIINLNHNSSVKIGKLGVIIFKKGCYVYIGSALNSLKSRIKRHLSDEKKLFWHIDYLLNSKNSTVDDVIFEQSKEKWECKIANEISKIGKPVEKFGCSDCKCNSHLYYFSNLEDAKNTCIEAFQKFELNPKNLDKLNNGT